MSDTHGENPASLPDVQQTHYAAWMHVCPLWRAGESPVYDSTEPTCRWCHDHGRGQAPGSAMRKMIRERCPDLTEEQIDAAMAPLDAAGQELARVTASEHRPRPDGIDRPEYPCCYRCFTGRHEHPGKTTTCQCPVCAAGTGGPQAAPAGS